MGSSRKQRRRLLVEVCATCCATSRCFRASRRRRARGSSGSSCGSARRRTGWWQPAVAAGDEVADGQLLGTLRTLYGDVIEELHASRDGVVLFLTTSPAVSVDGPLLGLGAELKSLVPRRGTRLMTFSR